MATRLPASQRTREELTALIEGRLSTASAKDELIKLASRLIVEEAFEGEAGDALGRDYYEHGAQPGRGYRNGYRTGRLKTAEGLMEYSAPQVAGRDEPFRSAIREHLLGHAQRLVGRCHMLRRRQGTSSRMFGGLRGEGITVSGRSTTPAFPKSSPVAGTKDQVRP